MRHKSHFFPGKVSINSVPKDIFTIICVFTILIVLHIAWDLLRIDVYGFKAFCQWFLSTYPTYFVSPLRLSGSAVESLFSQYKFSAGGKLDSVNYTTSRAAHLVKQCTTDHHSGSSYRDESLKFTELPLQKKQYHKHT